jgi:hypothetical protein
MNPIISLTKVFLKMKLSQLFVSCVHTSDTYLLYRIVKIFLWCA